MVTSTHLFLPSGKDVTDFLETVIGALAKENIVSYSTALLKNSGAPSGPFFSLLSRQGMHFKRRKRSDDLIAADAGCSWGEIPPRGFCRTCGSPLFTLSPKMELAEEDENEARSNDVREQNGERIVQEENEWELLSTKEASGEAQEYVLVDSADSHSDASDADQ